MMNGVKGQYRTTHFRLASGRTKIYYYTKPGGTKFFECWDAPLQEPFPADFVERFLQASNSEKVGATVGTISQLLIEFINSKRYADLSVATKESYQRDLDLALESLGHFPIIDIQSGAFRKEIVKWHDAIALRSPRRADLCVTALSSALGYAYKRGEISANPAIGIQKAWKRPDDKRPWTEDEIKLFLQDCPQTTADIFLLAMYTGMRRQDLANVTWDAFNGRDIQWQTSKSRQRRTIVVPLTSEGILFIKRLRASWNEKVSGFQRTMLLSAGGKSMTAHTLGKKINQRARALGIDKTLHRQRNTYATVLVRAGFDPHEIAGIMGWSYDEVQQLIRIYVRRSEIIAAQVAKLDSAKKPWRNS